MSDLVKRLRRSGLSGYADLDRLLDEAADRIEALEQEIRWALNVPSTGDGAAAEAMRIILRRALQPPEGDT